MDNIQKQLIAKLGEEFTNIFPLQYVSNILDKATGETLTILLTRYNHVFIPFTGDKNVTRAAVPAIMRRKGLYITYITPNSEIITEYFKGNKTEVNNEDWVKDENWGTNITSDNFVPITLPDGSVTAEKLSQEVLDLIGQGFKGNIENHPDGEDLTSTELATVGNTKYKVLRFADRNYTQDGMGYVILRKDKTFAEQVTKSNTIYEIRYNFDLNGETVSIPEGCVLKFEGGSFKEGTIQCSNTILIGNRFLDKSIILKGTFDNDYIYFDWFINEKWNINDNRYSTFINDNNSEFSELPSISNINSTILYNLTNLSNGKSIKFGTGIYPFDSPVEGSIESHVLSGVSRNDTLLWFPLSDGFIRLVSTNSIIENLWLECKGDCVTIKENAYPHAPIFRNSAFISYTSNCFKQLGGLYGGLFENLLVYSTGNKETCAFYKFTSNSNVFRNVVDSHVFFNGKNTNKKGYMFSMFYNSSCKEYTGFNITYSGFKYLFYYKDTKDNQARIAIHDGTLEMNYDSNNEAKFIRLIHTDDSSSLWNLYISYFNIYRIGKGKDNIDFYIKRASNSSTFLRAQENMTVYANTFYNESDCIIKALTPPVDVNKTKSRIFISFPHSGNRMNLFGNSSQNKEIFQKYKVPIEWYEDIDSISYLGILPSELYSNISIPKIATSSSQVVKDIIYREKFGRLAFLDSETGVTKQIPLLPYNTITPSNWDDVDSFFSKGDIRLIFQIVSNIDLNGKTVRVRPNWIFVFNGGSLNNGTIPSAKTTYIDFKGTAIINGSKTFGRTNNRPSLTANDLGFTYYDTSINESLTWSGNGWINPDGTDINRVNFIKTITDVNNLESGDRLLRIVENIDLNGATLILPSGCTLDFQGGSFSNGTIVGNETKIIAGLQKIFDTDITLSGTWSIADAYSEWFGAKKDGITDDYLPIQKTLDSFRLLKLNKGTYNITLPIKITSNTSIYGVNNKTCILQKTGNGTIDDINAVLIITSTATYASGINLSLFTISSVGYNVDYGIYAPQFSNSTLNCIDIWQCKTGIYLTTSWGLIFTQLDISSNTRYRIPGSEYGYPIDTTYGIYCESSGGTSFIINRCYIHGVAFGYYIKGIHKINFNNATVDNFHNTAFHIEGCEGSLNSCGCENGCIKSGLYLMYLANTVLKFENFVTAGVKLEDTNTSATLFTIAYSSIIKLINSKIEDVEIVGTFNYLRLSQASSVEYDRNKTGFKEPNYFADADSVIKVIEKDTIIVIKNAGRKNTTYLGIPSLGSTANRPTSAPVGFCYYDMTIAKPIWVKTISENGITWIDATGSTV